MPLRCLLLLLCAGLALAGLAAGCASGDPDEPYRPQLHYSPARGWLNDPNGLVYDRGIYHLFYQHNPAGRVWQDRISWGHAVSRDLVHWRELPVAIPHGGDESVFSGSVVVDEHDTSGLGRPGRPPMVAIYTGARPGSQAQSLAYSTDEGRTWTKYPHNPVLDIGSAEFRDPKVFWYAPGRRWIMTVALPQERKVAFYSSRDLRHWEHLTDFGPANAVDGVWECPDLVEMPVAGEPGQTRWMLTVSLNPGAIAGGSGTQYFLGRFDGRRFVADDDGDPPPAGRPLPDFRAWSATGDAFAEAAAGAHPADSFHGADDATGTLTSPPFRIDRRHLNFQVAGGAGPDTAVRLVVDGATVRSTAGRDSGRLDWTSWDVGDLAGREARIAIADRRGGDWGHVLADGFSLADAPARSSVQRARWLDYGPDYYAAVSYNNAPGPRPLMVGWMSNWAYADHTPTAPWRGAMALPRELGLRRVDGRLEVVQHPVGARARQRAGGGWRERPRTLAAGTHALAAHGQTLDIEAAFTPRGAARFGLHVRAGDHERTVIGYDARTHDLYVDRRRSGRVRFAAGFAGVHRAPLAPGPDGLVRMRVIVDRSSVEVFGGDGERVITSQVFPATSSDRVAVFAQGGAVAVDRLDVSSLRPAVPARAGA